MVHLLPTSRTLVKTPRLANYGREPGQAFLIFVLQEGSTTR